MAGGASVVALPKGRPHNKQVKTPFTVEDVARGNDYCRLAVASIPRIRNGRSTGICGGCFKASPCRDRVVPRGSRTLSVRPLAVAVS